MLPYSHTSLGIAFSNYGKSKIEKILKEDRRGKKSLTENQRQELNLTSP